MSKCEHKQTRLWGKADGVVRRCRDCGAIQGLKGADKQQVKKDQAR